MNLFPSSVLNLLSISMIVSVIVMALIQKLKSFSFLKKEWHIGICNLFCSFLFGISFSYLFYQIPFEQGIWVSLFTFVEAPTLYKMFKNQSIINVKPIALDDLEAGQKKEKNR